MAVSVGEEIDELQRKIALLGKDKEWLALFQLYQGDNFISQMVTKRLILRAHNGQ